ncbi:hypothetical protein NC651_010471 [Populus alba x Populus x berolinensis]|nr:hypothetical protein NC651_010471 [Populus alba x Populus x berolinensis]
MGRSNFLILTIISITLLPILSLLSP